MNSKSSERSSSTLLPIALICFLLIQMAFTALMWRDVRALRGDLQFARTSAITGMTSKGACPGLEIGTKAPALVLSDTNGNQVSLDDYEGKSVLLVFSSTTCPYCEQLYDDLKLYDEQFRTDSSVLLLVSRSADVTENQTLKQEQAFEFAVLNATDEVFQAFFIPGTPTAVLVSDEGTISACSVVSDVEGIAKFVAAYTE